MASLIFISHNILLQNVLDETAIGALQFAFAFLQRALAPQGELPRPPVPFIKIHSVSILCTVQR